MKLSHQKFIGLLLICFVEQGRRFTDVCKQQSEKKECLLFLQPETPVRFTVNLLIKSIAMSFVKVMIHAVWGTKNREQVLLKSGRTQLFSHIRENVLKKGIYIDTINGYLDHVHCLFELNAEISLSQTLQLIKGEASYWANKQQLLPAKLYWSDEYFAASVSESVLANVRAYINNQEAHHQKLGFADEYELFLQKQGSRKDEQRNQRK